MTYNDLAGRIDFPAPHRIHRLTELLEVTIREDHAAGLPLLAAMAVSRSQNGIPGRGFFQLLAQLADLFSQADIREKLRSQLSPTDVVDILSSATHHV